MITSPATGAMAVVVNTLFQVFNAGSSWLFTQNNLPNIGGEIAPPATTP